MNNIQLTENFNLLEFQCTGQGCCRGSVKLDSKLLFLLQELRDVIGLPIYITSGYRCPTHNTNVGGAERSQHVEGKAADVSIDKDMVYVAEIAKRIGFTGVGYYDRFLHLDVRDGNYVEWRG